MPARLWEPPDGRVLHIAGQTHDQVAAYMREVCDYGAACPVPAGAAAYTHLAHHLFDRVDHAPGNTQDVSTLLSHHPPLLLQLALYLHRRQLAQVANGDTDAQIDRLGAELRQTARPVLLRIGYEFDGPHNGYDPAAYQAAYRRIVDRIRIAGAANCAYVWHSYAVKPTYHRKDPMAWYPGHDYVDWVGISLFSFEPIGPVIHRLRPNQTALLKLADRLDRPVVVAEASAIKVGARRTHAGPDAWESWYSQFFSLLSEHPRVKAFTIISCNWNDIAQSSKLNWGDARIESDAVVLDRWRGQMRDQRFLHNSEKTFEVLEHGTL